MAIWQFTLVLVPRPWAIANAYNPTSLSNETGYDTSAAWLEHSPIQDIFIQHCDKFLSRSEPWAEGLTAWGDDEETDINLWQGSGKIESIRIRLDLRKDPRKPLSVICEIMNAIDCSCFIPESNLLIDPDPGRLFQIIRDSRASSFVKAPFPFLQALGENRQDH